MHVDLKSQLAKEFKATAKCFDAVRNLTRTQIEDETGEEAKLLTFYNDFPSQWVDDWSSSRINLDGTPLFAIKELQVYMEGQSNRIKCKAQALNQLNLFLQMADRRVTNTPKNLIEFFNTIKEEVYKSEHRWMFTKTASVEILYYYVYAVQYFPEIKEKVNKQWEITQHEQVRLYFSYIQHGQKNLESTTFYRDDIHGKTISEALEYKQLFLETEGLFQKFLEDNEWFQEISKQTGQQFMAEGPASGGITRWGRTEQASFTIEGENMRVVMDNETDEVVFKSNDRSPYHGRNGKNLEYDSSTLKFWVNHASETGQVDEDMSVDDPAQLPVWPYVNVFSFHHEKFLQCHSKQLQYYPWDKTAFDKLILPEVNKDMVTTLVGSSRLLEEDIIKGKSGGIIVIATGSPGTGKTLTAEVYSEYAEKPLYVVSGTQLGIDIGSIEKNLSVILNRASRWKAILLLDEADVYIHTRGDNLVQNAIVGIFLKTLEYYKGTLFMTSNRPDVIDDAIMSRSIAHIHYEIPDQNSLEKILKVLTKQYKLEVSDKDIAEMASQYNGISGRDAKGLIRLAKFTLASDPSMEFSLDLVRKISQFKSLATKKNV